ncbi:MAG: MoaD/ThiS family protein [Promethearchaeota archaeon]
MKLNLEFSPPFNEITGKVFQTMEFEKPLTLRELLQHLKEKFGQKFYDLIWENGNENQFNKLLSIIINGHSYRYEKFLDTILKDGDDVVFIYIYFGG